MDPATALDRMVKVADEARNLAYAPYSGYAVGAAVLTGTGEIFTGCNVENGSYGLTLCAERVAILKAVAEGHREIRALVVITEDGASPCGACRQVLFEFGRKAEVFLVDAGGERRSFTVDELLPEAFDLPPEEV